MAVSRSDSLSQVLAGEPELLEEWLSAQRTSPTARPDRLGEAALRRECAEFLTLLRVAVARSAVVDESDDAWQAVHEFLAELSRSRARLGFSPAETSSFVLSLKRPLFSRLQQLQGDSQGQLADELWTAGEILDRLAMRTVELYQREREDVIRRQQQELLELSTPVIKLWQGILAVPLIGTLDSSRTQVVMESLLQRIVETNSEIAIIDITGVPTVDTLVAQHLLRTVAAARLMGADCIISGIRPAIAQTIVQLGVELGDVATKATMADAVALALRKLGVSLTRSDG